MKTILRLEQVILLILTLYLYFFHYHYSWKLFVLLLLVPDISMVGYLFGSQIGAIVYNVVHSMFLPVILFVLGKTFKMDALILVSLILFSHIFMDRSTGYGLKYFGGFKHTHLT